VRTAEGYYLCTSFGKGSIAVQRLCDEAGVKYDAHHNVTGIDPPELVYFGRKYYPDVIREPYKMSMWRLIEKNGILPMRHMKFCCDVLKEQGGKGRALVLGIRSAESNRRAKQWGTLTNKDISKKDRKAGKLIRLFEPDDISDAINVLRSGQGCSGPGKYAISPMYFWSDTDLWDFIKDRKLSYCSLYDEGYRRLGCIGCPCAKERERRHAFERWPGFYRLYVQAIQKLIDAGRYNNKGETAEEVMEWWLKDKVQERPIDGQLSLDDVSYIESEDNNVDE
jgi:phosphoadenosine phosphosulfate reductase